MAMYQMTCSCGDPMSVEAGSREEAVEKLQGTMTEEAIKAHMDEKHAGQPIPSVMEMHADIAQKLTEV